MATRRTLMLVLFAAVIVAAAAGYLLLLGQPKGPDLESTTAAKTIYPGSTVLLAIDVKPEGRNGYLQLVGSDASLREIADYYRARLSEIGFVEGAGLSGARTTSELYACAWHDDTLVVRLSFLSERDARERYPEVANASRAYASFYRWLIVDRKRVSPPVPCMSIPRRT